MDERLGLVILVWIIWNVVALVSTALASVAENYNSERDGWRRGCGFILIGVPVSIVLLVMAGWVDQALWNFLAPTFNLPTIDLLTAIVLGLLIASLFRGIAPQRVSIAHDFTKRNA